MADPIKVYLLEAHDEVRQALLTRLCTSKDIQVVGDSTDAEAGLLDIKMLQPDVVLVETKRPDGRGLEIINWLAHSGLRARVIVLTSYLSDWEKWAAFRAGAARYLLKEVDSGQLIKEIHAVAQEER